MSLDFKKNITDLFELNCPADFVLKVNKMITKFILWLVAISMLLGFLRFLANFQIVAALITLILSPLIFFMTKYFLALYLIIIDWISASTGFYKSQIK